MKTTTGYKKKKDWLSCRGVTEYSCSQHVHDFVGS